VIKLPELGCFILAETFLAKEASDWRGCRGKLLDCSLYERYGRDYSVVLVVIQSYSR